jgi:hypothetical protein
MQRSLELHRGQVQWTENLAALEEHAGNRDVAAKLREAVERRTKGMGGPIPFRSCGGGPMGDHAVRRDQPSL